MTKDDLLPCPFCGKSEPVRLESYRDEEHKDYFYIVCSVIKGGCGGMSGYFKTRLTAYKKWNSRGHYEGEPACQVN